MKTLENIAPVPIRLDIGGERIEITPCAVKDFPRLMAAAAPILEDLTSGRLVYALAANVRAVQHVVAEAVGRDVDWVSGLDLSDQASLLKACWEANAPFFAEEVLPMITGILTDMADKLGPTLSMPLSGPDTGSKKSSPSRRQD